MTAKIIIAGSRSFNDYKLLNKEMTKFLKDQKLTDAKIIVLSGAAWGSDKLGEQWAEVYEHEMRRYPAKWEIHGVAAGPIRNREMAKKATHCIVFWDGKSVGSKNMIEEAKKHKLKLKVVKFTPKGK